MGNSLSKPWKTENFYSFSPIFHLSLFYVGHDHPNNFFTIYKKFQSEGIVSIQFRVRFYFQWAVSLSNKIKSQLSLEKLFSYQAFSNRALVHTFLFISSFQNRYFLKACDLNMLVLDPFVDIIHFLNSSKEFRSHDAYKVKKFASPDDLRFLPHFSMHKF